MRGNGEHGGSDSLSGPRGPYIGFMTGFPILKSLLADPVAAYAAVLSTLSFLMALPLTIEAYRRSRRDRGRLQVQHAEAGCVLRGALRYDNINLTLINVGTPAVSITGYELRVYEGRLNLLLRRNPVIYSGNGWRVPREAEAFTLALADGMSPPFSVMPGEPIRLEIHTPPLWRDRSPRRVVAVVTFSHSRKPLRINIRPKPWIYVDAPGLEEISSLTSSAIEHSQTAGASEKLFGQRKKRWWY